MPLRIRRLRPRLLPTVLSLAVIGVAACTAPEPTQPVDFRRGLLNIDISDQWVPERAKDKQMTFAHPALADVRLSFVDQTRDYGTPMTTAGVRGAIGSELNLRYGGVNARLSLGGNALLHYARDEGAGNEKVHTQNWVLARPLGHSAIARVAITLKVPQGNRTSLEIQKLIESLDKQIGDAKMRKV